MPRIHTHPGEILREDFMAPLGLSATALAAALGVPTNRLTAVIAGDRSVTPNTALRLARYFHTSPEVWLNLQAAHELSKEIIKHGAEISDRVKPREAA